MIWYDAVRHTNHSEFTTVLAVIFVNIISNTTLAASISALWWMHLSWGKKANGPVHSWTLNAHQTANIKRHPLWIWTLTLRTELIIWQYFFDCPCILLPSLQCQGCSLGTWTIHSTAFSWVVCVANKSPLYGSSNSQEPGIILTMALCLKCARAPISVWYLKNKRHFHCLQLSNWGKHGLAYDLVTLIE